MRLQLTITVMFLKEGSRFVAYTPALDLSTSGKTPKEVRKRFEEAAALFLEEITREGTINEALGDLGWKKVGRKWRPPVVVSHGSETVAVPV